MNVEFEKSEKIIEFQVMERILFRLLV